MLVATISAFVAAACFAVAAAFQHRSAGLVSETSRVGGLVGFVSLTLRHPLWLIGTVADVVGFALHALALREGPLTLVQPVLVTGVIFAFPLRRILEHRRPRKSEFVWAGAMASGLALFLVVATPASGTVQAADPIPTAIAVVLVVSGIAGGVVAGRRLRGDAAAVALGSAAGLAFAAEAGLLKELADTFARGIGPLLTTWPLYALIAVGISGLMLNQLAYRAAPLRISLPVITTIDPVASLVIGVAVFDEHFRTAPAALLGELIGLTVVLVATIALSRSGADAARPTRTPGAVSRQRRPPGRRWDITSS